MPHVSTPDLLVLHAVRLKGMAEAGDIVRRFPATRDRAQELLLDFEARGWVQQVSFPGSRGWALTTSGRAHGELLLRLELDRTGARHLVTSALSAFEGLNAQFLEAITRWQVRPSPGDPLAANDHSDWPWDEDVRAGLHRLAHDVAPIVEPLAGALARFDGYPERLAAALDRVDRGQRTWVDGVGIDSCHRVWFELHEDLLATLGRERGAA